MKEGMMEAENQFDCIKMRADFQEQLVIYYKEQVLKVPTFPLQQERYLADIRDLYFPPCMTVEARFGIQKFRKPAEIPIHEMLKKDGKSLKNIYIIGEAGSGKTALCKYIVSNWCRAHDNIGFNANESEEVTEMAKFDFLFYVSLLQSSDCKNIQTMLEKHYPNPILRKLLEKEKKILILLDGLDEWNPVVLDSTQFQTVGLPKRDTFRDYTVITTSRQWKFDALSIKDSEVGRLIKLRGINENSARALIEKRMESLNEPLETNVVATEFEKDFQKIPVSFLSKMPMVLEHLVYLWFEGKIDGTSKCAVYSSILNMFCKWHDLKILENQTDRKTEITTVDTSFQLPEYLSCYESCFNYRHTIEKLSRLAFQTLFDKKEENRLAFPGLALQEVKISNAEKKLCLEVGILSQHRSQHMLASVRQYLLFSFVQKSFQEYLAAVYIAVKFKTILKSSEEEGNNDDICKQSLLQIIGTDKTAEDILEMANIFTFLCGLEPQLTTSISEYICNAVTVDEGVIKARTELDNNFRIIMEIQKCVNYCIKESRSMGKRSRIYLADVVISHEIGTDDLCLEEQLIVPECVRSLYISETRESRTENAMNCFANCENLNALWYDRDEFDVNSTGSEKIDEKLIEILKNNSSQLQLLSLKHIKYPQTVIPFNHCLPALQQLTSLAITDAYLSHETCISLRTILSRATQLQQISIDIDCNSGDQHILDLTNHMELKTLDITYCCFFVNNFSTQSLETCRLGTENTVRIHQVCNTLNSAGAIRQLELAGQSCFSSDTAANRMVTENVARLLPSLARLHSLRLQGFTFTANILTSTLDLKTLEHIYLADVCMAFTVWCRFIESLLALPDSIKVTTCGLYITPAGSGPSNRPRRHRGQVETARQYVREKIQLFRVILDDPYVFVFITNKLMHD